MTRPDQTEIAYLTCHSTLGPHHHHHHPPCFNFSHNHLSPQGPLTLFSHSVFLTLWKTFITQAPNTGGGLTITTPLPLSPHRYPPLHPYLYTPLPKLTNTQSKHSQSKITNTSPTKKQNTHAKHKITNAFTKFSPKDKFIFANFHKMSKSRHFKNTKPTQITNNKTSK